MTMMTLLLLIQFFRNIRHLYKGDSIKTIKVSIALLSVPATMNQPLLLLFCLIGSSLAVDFDLEKVYKTCGSKFPTVDPLVMQEFCEPSFQTSDKNAKCLIKCFGEETGFSSADGKLVSVDNFLNQTSPEVAAKLDPEITKCTAMVKPDSCETAYEQWKCFCEALYSVVPVKNP